MALAREFDDDLTTIAARVRKAADSISSATPNAVAVSPATARDWIKDAVASLEADRRAIAELKS
jgi:hypothetical protein